MLETINFLAFTIPFIAAGAAYSTLQQKAVPKIVSIIIAFGILVGFFVSYLQMYRGIGFPLWMRWLAPAALAEPLPGRPEVNINTRLNAEWTIVGMNYNWMVLVAKAHIQIGSFPEAYMRWEFAGPQKSENGKGYLSEVQMVELDCKRGRWNPLIITSYSNNNLSGEEVYVGRGDRRQPLWDTPDPTSIFGAAVVKACELFVSSK